MYNLVKYSSEYLDYLDIELYENLLIKESKKQNVKINVPQMIEFLDELSHAGLTGTEYRSISNEEILEDYLTYIKYL
jgi:hypothetical protein|tara:strand:+ start:2685 stop:2915 length:231 start_codon:yes stop_codon:yes gene_type:complete